jgi:enamine deaminase RidA (YjgF/YER057c/UK114 family)
MTSRVFSSLIAGALLASWMTSSAWAADIERLPKVPPGPVLDAVVLPPDAEVMIISGQTPAPLDPAKTEGLDDFGDMTAQATSVFEKIKAILARKGYSMKDIVKLSVFVVADPRKGGLADFAAMNEVYHRYFGVAANPNLPARTSLQIAALGRPGYRIEIEAFAARTARK